MVVGPSCWLAYSQGWPRVQLYLSARAITKLPVTSAPILLRGSGQPASVTSLDLATRGSGGLPANLEPYRIALNVASAEQLLGETADSACLKTRLLILDGKDDEAVEKAQLSAKLYPRSPCVPFVTGLAYGSRAARDDRASDYVLAAEAFLRAESDLGVTGPDLWFNLAVTFSRMPAPHIALRYWKRTLDAEASPEWRETIQKLQKEWQDRLEARNVWEAKIRQADPASVPRGGLDILVSYALSTWLQDPARYAEPLDRLARYLRDQRHDPWLWDLLRQSPDEPRKLLSSAASAQREGRRADAARLALAAYEASRKTTDEATRIAAAVEAAETQFRTLKAGDCLDTIGGVRERAARRSYRWLETRAWFIEIRCKVQTRKVDILDERLEFSRKIAGSGYDGIVLLSKVAFSDPMRSLTTSSEAWQSARGLLEEYWSGVYSQTIAVGFYASQALAANLMGLPKASVLLVEEAVETLGNHPNHVLRSDLWADLGDSELRRNRPRSAAAFYRKSVEAAATPEDVRRQNILADAALASAEAEDGRKAEASALLRKVAQQATLPYSGFGLFDRLRLLPALGNAYLRVGSSKEALEHYSASVKECQDRLKDLSGRTQRQTTLRESEEAWRGMVRAQLQVGEPNRALRYWQMFRGGRDPGEHAVTPPAGTVWLSYAAFGDGLALWLADAAGVEYHWLAAAGLATVADRLRASLSSPTTSPELIDELSRQLHQGLLSPIRGRLGAAKTIVIDADQWVASVPWNILRDPSGGILLDKHAIVLSNGWQETAQRMAGPPPRLQPALVVADPVLAPDSERRFRPLPDARLEAQALRRSFPDSRLLIGGDARLSQVRDALPQHRLLHFAGHGVSYGGFGALLLSPDGGGASLLTAQQISGLDLSGLDLAVLSACSSGVGELSGLLDLDSLVRSFLEAGAATVVSTQWNIASRTSGELIEIFYAELLKGAGPADALRKAALAIRAQSRSAHPYYWAAFQLSGRP